jgi:hypothetical protein
MSPTEIQSLQAANRIREDGLDPPTERAVQIFIAAAIVLISPVVIAIGAALCGASAPT